MKQETITYQITGGFSESQLHKFHEKVLWLIEKMGISVCPEVKQILPSDPSFMIESNRVKIKSEKVEKYLAKVRMRGKSKQVEDSSSIKYSIIAPGALPFYQEDIITGKLHPLNCTDSIENCKLCDMLSDDGVHGQATGLPQDVPLPLQGLTACKIGLEYCRNPGGVGVTSLLEFNFMNEMLAVVGKKSNGVGVHILNPMRIEGNEVLIALARISANRNTCVGVASMPILGVTVPIHLATALIEGAAAVIAAATIFDAITEGDVHFDISSIFPFDMKVATIAYGTPQHLLSFLAGKQINEYYGKKTNYIRSLHTNASSCNVEGSSIRALQTSLGALNGFTDFGYGGMLGIDKVFSPMQLMIDMEIVRYVKYVADGFDFSEKILSLNDIFEVGPDGNFADHPVTLDNFRALLWHPLFFDNQSVEKHLVEGDHLRKKIFDFVQGKIKAHNYHLSDEQQKELNRIYLKASKILMEQQERS